MRLFHRREVPDWLAARLTEVGPTTGDLVDELRVCTGRQDAEWALEVWAEADRQPLVVAE